jgi:hypothetical protein
VVAEHFVCFPWNLSSFAILFIVLLILFGIGDDDAIKASNTDDKDNKDCTFNKSIRWDKNGYHCRKCDGSCATAERYRNARNLPPLLV